MLRNNPHLEIIFPCDYRKTIHVRCHKNKCVSEELNWKAPSGEALVGSRPTQARQHWLTVTGSSYTSCLDHQFVLVKFVPFRNWRNNWISCFLCLEVLAFQVRLHLYCSFSLSSCFVYSLHYFIAFWKAWGQRSFKQWEDLKVIVSNNLCQVCSFVGKII